MGFHKNYKGLCDLPEVQELMTTFLKRNYCLYWCDDTGLRMQKRFTEIHFIPEADRLRLCIHDDGIGEKETERALKIGADIVTKYEYKQGQNIFDDYRHGGLKECEDEFYKYFSLTKEV